MKFKFEKSVVNDFLFEYHIFVLLFLHWLEMKKIANFGTDYNSRRILYYPLFIRNHVVELSDLSHSGIIVEGICLLKKNLKALKNGKKNLIRSKIRIICYEYHMYFRIPEWPEWLSSDNNCVTVFGPEIIEKMLNRYQND